VYHHRDLVLEESQRRARRFIEEFLYILDLDEMIARPEGPLLGPPSLIGLFAHKRRVGALDAPAGLDPFEVRRVAVALFDSPSGALDEDLLPRVRAKTDLSLRADAGRYLAIKDPDEVPNPRGNLRSLKVAPEEANPSIDVVTDTSRRDDAFLQIKGCDTANRKPVPGVNVGHGHGIAYDPGESGHIGDLGDRLRFELLSENRVNKY
jgi:hypothetical protein